MDEIAKQSLKRVVELTLKENGNQCYKGGYEALPKTRGQEAPSDDIGISH